jgi:hypothetical protein
MMMIKLFLIFFFLIMNELNYAECLIISLLMPPTAGAQAFLMDHPQGEGAITHHAGRVWGGYSYFFLPLSP